MNADMKVATQFASLGMEEVTCRSGNQKLGQVIKRLPGCCANTNQIDSPQFSSVKGKNYQLISCDNQ